MIPLTGIQKQIADSFMRGAIRHHVKREYFKKGINPTAEQVMRDIPGKKLDILLQQGYARDEIKKMVEDAIGSRK